MDSDSKDKGDRTQRTQAVVSDFNAFNFNVCVQQAKCFQVAIWMGLQKEIIKS
jgi:hypothetical protein